MYKLLLYLIIVGIGSSFLSQMRAFLAINEWHDYNAPYLQSRPPIYEAINITSGLECVSSEDEFLASLLMAELLTPLHIDKAKQFMKMTDAYSEPSILADRMRDRIKGRIEVRKHSPIDLVVSHCFENLDWIAQIFNHSKVFIFEKCGVYSELASVNATIISLANRGTESLPYAEYIDNHLDVTHSSHAILVHGNPFNHTERFMIELIMKAFESGSLNDVEFAHLSNRRFLSGSSFCLRDLQRVITGQVDAHIGSYCCSQFLVSKDRLRATRDAGTSQKISSILLGNETDLKCSQKLQAGQLPGHHISAALEHLWPRLMGEPSVTPRRAHDPRLPLFLRNEQKTYEDLQELKYIHHFVFS